MDSKEGSKTVGSSDLVNQPNAKTPAPSTSGLQKAADPSPGSECSKIFSRNCNGTVVMTSVPSNEAELQLYRVMQRASLLAYYDTLLEMGGDDVQQLCDAGEEEFLEIMALVGMASKPLHVRRLQKALQEWMTSPALFQTPLTSTAPTSPNNVSHLTTLRPLNALPVLTQTISPSGFCNNPPAPKEPSPSSSPDQSQIVSTDAGTKDAPTRNLSPGLLISSQGPGSPLQASPVLVQSQISKLAEAAEALVKTLPHFEPKPHNAKRKICKDLENVMNMAEDDPRRMNEIRKYAAIYGRFDCKRNPQKPLTLHEVSVNEAAAQICRFSPALLTRRDDLFALARQVVRDSGYHYAKGHASVVSAPKVPFHQTTNKLSEDNHSSKRPKLDSTSILDNGELDRVKKQERLVQIADELRLLGEKTEELVQAAQHVRQTNDLSSIQSLQQQMEAVQSKQTQLLLEQSELLKQPLPSRIYRRSNNSRIISSQCDSERHDTDDTDSQFSLSNASSPSQEMGDSRDSLLRDGESAHSNDASSAKSPGKVGKQHGSDILDEKGRPSKNDFFFQDSKVQVISASGANIIAVANPALSMSSVILKRCDMTDVTAGCLDYPLSLKMENHDYENHGLE